MSQTLLEMTKDLVLAQIEARRLSPDEMHTALEQTYTSLLALQAQEDSNGIVAVATPETQPEPVNWRKSITKDTVTCLACGQSFKQLRCDISRTMDWTDGRIGKSTAFLLVSRCQRTR